MTLGERSIQGTWWLQAARDQYYPDIVWAQFSLERGAPAVMIATAGSKVRDVLAGMLDCCGIEIQSVKIVSTPSCANEYHEYAAAMNAGAVDFPCILTRGTKWSEFCGLQCLPLAAFPR
jgi:hypothetical protein